MKGGARPACEAGRCKARNGGSEVVARAISRKSGAKWRGALGSSVIFGSPLLCANSRSNAVLKTGVALRKLNSCAASSPPLGRGGSGSDLQQVLPGEAHNSPDGILPSQISAASPMRPVIGHAQTGLGLADAKSATKAPICQIERRHRFIFCCTLGSSYRFRKLFSQSEDQFLLLFLRRSKYSKNEPSPANL